MIFIDHLRNGRPVSKWKLFIWSLNGVIPIMDDEQLRERFGADAYAVLVAEATPAKEPKPEKRKKPLLRKKKRKLMPQDYAWFLREHGRKYEKVDDPRGFLNSPRSGHRHLTVEEKEQKKQQRLQDWWEMHTDEVSRAKEKAATRRAKKKLRNFRESIYNRREQEALSRKTVSTVAMEQGPRTAFLRVKPELYKVITCGECPVFCWTEVPGKEDMFLANEYGPVKRVAIRPPGMSMHTPWVEFDIEWLRRVFRESSSSGSWVWEIGLGKRIEESDDSPQKRDFVV